MPKFIRFVRYGNTGRIEGVNYHIVGPGVYCHLVGPPREPEGPERWHPSSGFTSAASVEVAEEITASEAGLLMASSWEAVELPDLV